MIILNGRKAEPHEEAAIVRGRRREREKDLEALSGVLTTDVFPARMGQAAPVAGQERAA